MRNSVFTFFIFLAGPPVYVRSHKRWPKSTQSVLLLLYSSCTVNRRFYKDCGNRYIIHFIYAVIWQIKDFRNILHRPGGSAGEHIIYIQEVPGSSPTPDRLYYKWVFYKDKLKVLCVWAFQYGLHLKPQTTEEGRTVSEFHFFIDFWITGVKKKKTTVWVLIQRVMACNLTQPLTYLKKG